MRSSFIILIFLAGLWGDFTHVYNQNKVIDGAYDAYFTKDYDVVIDNISVLMDSLGMDEPGLKLNRAHAFYMLNGFGGELGTNYSNRSDSTYIKSSEVVFYNYAGLWDTDDQLSSIGYNQAGITTFKSRVVNGSIAEEEALLQSAIGYFKSALRENPNNEEARYNYELLKKYKEFPEMVMNRVRDLVKQRRYADALMYLGPFVEKDKRFEKHAEYGKRLSDIVKIETEQDES